MEPLPNLSSLYLPLKAFRADVQSDTKISRGQKSVGQRHPLGRQNAIISPLNLQDRPLDWCALFYMCA